MQPAAADTKKRKKGKEWKENGKRRGGCSLFTRTHKRMRPRLSAACEPLATTGLGEEGKGGEKQTWTMSHQSCDHLRLALLRPPTTPLHTSDWAYLKRCSQHAWQRADPLSGNLRRVNHQGFLTAMNIDGKQSCSSCQTWSHWSLTLIAHTPPGL